MKRDKATRKEGGISDAAVQKATGKNWNSWFEILDQAGAKNKNHSEISQMLYRQNPEIGGWWSQMITVAYEQARGLRVMYQKSGGFEISRSKTIAVPVSRLYAAWSNSRSRSRWLKEKIEIRTSTRDKSMRVTWSDGKTGLSVYFYPKGEQRSQVVVQHMKLSSASQARRMQEYWQNRLADLAAILE